MRSACGAGGSRRDPLAAPDEVDDFHLRTLAQDGFRPRRRFYDRAVQFHGDPLAGNLQQAQKSCNCRSFSHLAGFAVYNNLNHFCSETGGSREILAKP